MLALKSNAKDVGWHIIIHIALPLRSSCDLPPGIVIFSRHLSRILSTDKAEERNAAGEVQHIAKVRGE